MQCVRLVVLLALHLAVSEGSQAQVTVAREQQNGYPFIHLDHTNGLISDEVFSFAQDINGYMWIGTRKGLQRYDGLRFVNYTDSTPVGDHYTIASIFPDDAGNRLLYNSFSTGIKEWQLLNNRLASLLPADQFRSALAASYTDDKGAAWQLQVYLPGQRQKEGIALLKEPGKAPYFVDYVKEPLRRRVWVYAAGHGLMVFDDSVHRMNSPGDPGNNAFLPLLKPNIDGLRKIVMDSRGNLWLITWGPLLYRFSTLSGNLYTYSLSEVLRQQGSQQKKLGWVTSLLEDDHGKIWVGTAYAGLLEYHADKDDLTYILHMPGNDLSIQYNREIEGLFQDRESTIWVGTDKGISLFNPYRQYFSTLDHPRHFPGPVPNNDVNCAMQTPDGDLLVGSWGNGINVYDGQLKRKNTLFFPGHRDKNLIWSFMINADGSTWAGCQHGYLHLIDAAHRSAVTSHPAALENSTVRCMERDLNGNILLGLHNGKIVTMDKQGGFLPFDLKEEPDSLPLAAVINIFIDKQGRCWVATINGLYQFDRERRCYKAKYKPMASAPAYCSGITEYDDSLLLIGIEHAGMYFFNRRSKAFSKLGSATEQPLLSAYAVRRDDAGRIWFTTDYDVCRYDPVEKKLLTYHPGKGLLNSPFVSSRFVVLRSGRWLAWTDNEVVIFSPDEISAAPIPAAKATITGLKVFDKPVFVDSFIHSQQAVRLSYKENFISIEYSGMQFDGTAQTVYYYRLSDIDKEWVYAGAGGSASYTNLLPGKYRFQVRAEGAGSSGSTATLEIIIVPPFWVTIWFRGLCLAVLAGILYLLIRWRIRHIRHDANMRQQIATTEMMALRAQMNPHFIFNCLNSIDALIQSDDKYHATLYLNKFAKLIRGILDSSKQNSISLRKDLDTLRLYIELEQFRNDNKFTAEIIADPQMSRDDYKVPPLIIQPYVENAILHGLRNRTDNNGKLFIGVTRQPGHLLYTIEDNGVGRQAAQKDMRRRSYGMEMSRDRVKLFNREEHAQVTVTDLHIDGRAAGTRVEVLLKIP